jgi:hypothetical protein
MEYQYHGIGFLAFTALFFLAGFIGLYRTWLGILAATIIGAAANFLLDGTMLGLIAGMAGGLVTGFGGEILIPIFWTGRKGRPASNIRFVNHGAMGRTTLHYNWIKDDNIKEPGQRR